MSRAEWKTGRMEEWKKNELSSVCVYVCVYVSTELDVRCEIMDYNVRRREKMSGGMSVGGIKLCTKNNQLISQLNNQPTNQSSVVISQSVSPSIHPAN